jgi:hypothetical protein
MMVRSSAVAWSCVVASTKYVSFKKHPGGKSMFDARNSVSEGSSITVGCGSIC